MRIIKTAAKKAGIHPETHYQWIRTDPEYAENVKQIDNYVLDFVESKMYQVINSGDAGTIRWHLSTKGKKRGYGQPNSEPEKTSNRGLDR